MQGNVNVTNRDFRKVIFKRKTVILDSYIKEDLVQGKFYRRTRLVTRRACTIWLVTCSTRLTTLSTRSTRLPTNSTGLSNRSTHLSTRSTRLSIRSICLTTRSICRSACSIRIYLSVFWRLCEHLWIENSKLCLTNAARERLITQTGKKLKTVFENIMVPGDRGAEGQHMGVRAEG